MKLEADRAHATTSRRASVCKAVAPAAVGTAQAGTLAEGLTFAGPLRRIVTFHLNGLGDLLFTLPALLALREGFPGATITAVIRPALAPLLRDSPLVDEILLRPRRGFRAQLILGMQLRRRCPDITVAFSQSRQTTFLAWTSGARVRAGFEAARMESLLTHRVAKDGPPTIETHLDLVRALGCATRQHDYNKLVQVAPNFDVAATRLLSDNGVTGEFIVAACEASERRGIKEWPQEHWAAALDDLAARRPVVLVGTAPTIEVTRRLKNPVVDLGGKTDLATLAALCGKARLFVGIDSGVMHLAAAMDVPVVGIFGPTDFMLTGPRGVPFRIARHPVECSPCMLTRCKWHDTPEERKCLTRLDAKTVTDAARDLLGV